MIHPTIGRVVLVRAGTPQPQAALVTFVHNDRLINAAGFTAEGHPFAANKITLLQDDDPAPASETYAEWMDYQKGQAAKTEALEAKQASSEAAPQAEANTEAEGEPAHKPAAKRRR